MKLGLSLRHTYRCYVCLEPITPRPRSELPVDVLQAVYDLREGKKPEICCSCGGHHDFNRERAHFRKYLQYLSMYVLTDDMRRELQDMARNTSGRSAK